MNLTTRRAFLRAATCATLATAAAGMAVPVLAQSGNSFGAANWMRIPKISVDSAISDVGITNGFYDVPWFDVGHHVDSHNPGEFGNSIYNGHVVTINAGDVFHHLDQLQAGDAIYIYTQAYRLDWAVSDAFSVAQDDNSFLADVAERRITLYTCTGDFNPIERSYAERLVVVGQMVSLSVRS
jgi:LPXTG-site transpeptidase (sortase) family protein